MGAQAIRILGIDPGLRRTGWGLVESVGNRLIYVACGSLETSERAELGERLVVIQQFDVSRGEIAIIEDFGEFLAFEGSCPHDRHFVQAGARGIRLRTASGLGRLTHET